MAYKPREEGQLLRFFDVGEGGAIRNWGEPSLTNKGAKIVRIWSRLRLDQYGQSSSHIIPY